MSTSVNILSQHNPQKFVKVKLLRFSLTLTSRILQLTEEQKKVQNTSSFKFFTTFLCWDVVVVREQRKFKLALKYEYLYVFAFWIFAK